MSEAIGEMTIQVMTIYPTLLTIIFIYESTKPAVL